MASPKKDKPAPRKDVKVLSKKESKKVVGGAASLVTGGLPGPEDLHFTGGSIAP